MEPDIKNTKMKYLECNNGDLHEGEILNLVCIDPTCKDNGMICSICRQSKHQQHKVMPLKMFLSEVHNKLKSKNQTNINLGEILENLENAQAKLLFSLKECVEQMAKKIRNIEEQLIDMYKKTKERILAQSLLGENMPKIIDNIINGDYNEAKSLKEDCKKLVDTVQIQQNKIEIECRPDKIMDDFQINVTEMIKEIKKHCSGFVNNTKIDKLVEKAQQVGKRVTSSVQGYIFSSTLKSTTINITDSKTALQNANQNYEQRFALLEPALDMTEKSKWGFQVKNLSNWIGIGICFKKNLQSKSFKFDYNNIGHGSYLISSNGYTWSHSKKEDNIAYKSFTFANNDIIYCEFDPEKAALTFKKKQGGNTFTLNVEVPTDDEVHACVNLCNKNDKIDIIDVEQTEQLIF